MNSIFNPRGRMVSLRQAVRFRTHRKSADTPERIVDALIPSPNGDTAPAQ